MKPHGVKLALLPIALILAACGGARDKTADELGRLDDQAQIATYAGNLARDAISGGDFLADTQGFARAIRQARADGLDEGWISDQIDSAEDSAADCSACIELLENVR